MLDFSIPASVCELEEGWCKWTERLTKVTIDPKNQYYMNCKEDERLVIGKSDPKSDIYNVLLFAPRDIINVTIPSYIKRIATAAFSHSSIEKVFIPSQITEIHEKAFYNCHKLLLLLRN